MFYCHKCGTPYEQLQPFCSQCGTPLQGATSQEPSPVGYDSAPSELAEQGALPMKWFKFVIYFQLFANAVANGINAIVTLTGSHYGGVADQVYTIIGGMQVFDVLMGIVLLGLVGLALYARSRLKNFCKNGPKMYYTVFAGNAIWSVVYILGAEILVRGSVAGANYQPDYSSMISSVVMTVIMLACSVVYFNKRKHLFVNDDI